MRRSLAVLPALALLSAACTSSGGGTAPTTSAGTRGSTSSAAASQLADKVHRGVAGLTSAHLAVDAGGLGLDMAGDVTFANGATTASDIVLDQGGTKVEVITVGGTSYAKPPAAQNTSGKPWVKVSDSSSNEFVRALAGTLSLTTAATSIGDLTGLLATAGTSPKDDGAESVDGVSSEHYTLTIDPTKVTGALGSALSVAHTKPLPVDLWIDAQGRPVQVKIGIPFGGKSLPLLVKISKFNAPVHISAPPASQVDSS